MTQDSPAVMCHKTVPRASVPEGESSLPYSHGPSATRLGGEKDQRQGEVPGKPWQLKMPSSEGMGTGQTHQAAARSPTLRSNSLLPSLGRPSLGPQDRHSCLPDRDCGALEAPAAVLTLQLQGSEETPFYT